MDVTLPNVVPTAEILPAKPEKMNMPRRYGSAVMIALKPLEYATPARPMRPLPPMIVAQTVAIRTSGPNDLPAQVVVVHIPHLADHDQSDQHHRNEISCNNQEINGVNLDYVP